MQRRAPPWAEHRARRAAGHVAAGRARPTACAPTRSPSRSARASRTAYNLLASLCDEGVAVRRPGGVYHLAPGFRDDGRRRATSDRHDLSGIVDDLLARTHKRAYARRGPRRRPARRDRARPAGHAEAAGHEPRDRATTPTRSRSARSCSRSPAPRPSSATSTAGLKRFTPAHHHRPATRCATELRELRRTRHRRRARGVRPRLLLHRRAAARRARAFPGRAGHLDVPTRIRRRARHARAHRRRPRRDRRPDPRDGAVTAIRPCSRRPFPAICRNAGGS